MPFFSPSQASQLAVIVKEVLVGGERVIGHVDLQRCVIAVQQRHTALELRAVQLELLLIQLTFWLDKSFRFVKKRLQLCCDVYLKLFLQEARH